MAAGDIFQQTVVAQVNAEPTANVFYLEVLDDTGTTDAEADAAQALQNGVLPVLGAFLSEDVAYECILSRRVRPTTAPARVFQLVTVGGLAQAALPANQCIKFRHFSDIGGRNRQGRWFFAGLPEADATNGRISNIRIGSYNAFAAVVAATITDAGRTYRLKHFSKKLNQFWDIDQAVVDPIPRKVRNRTPGLCSIS